MKNKIYDILSEILETKVDDTTDVSMDNCSKWDSVVQIDIIMSIEDEFGIKFSKEELVELKSQGKIIKVMKSKV